MYDLLMLAAFGLAAFLVAWVVNGLLGMMSGEKPGDTGRLWLDVFLRMFGILELGLIGRLLNNFGLKGSPRKAVLFVGLLCILLFLVRACRDDTPTDHIHSYPAQGSMIDPRLSKRAAGEGRIPSLSLGGPGLRVSPNYVTL